MKPLLIAALLFATAAPSFPATRIVLVAGTPSHPRREHEFNAGVTLLDKFLRQTPGVEPVIVRGGWPQDESVFDGAAALVFYMDGGANHPMIQGDRLQKIGALMKKGVGLACLHYAVEVPKDKGGNEFLEWLGGYYENGVSTNPINYVVVKQANPGHAISRGWKDFAATDEWYYKIHFRDNDKRFHPILQAQLPPEAANTETVSWVVEREDGGRGFGFCGGHFHENWSRPEFRRLVTNAILWTAKVQVPKDGAKVDVVNLNDLVSGLDSKPAGK